MILCFIDTGIDYQNPVFLDENGNSRVLAIWDQTVQTGAPPDGLKYGSEYRREDINLALRSEDPYSIVPPGTKTDTAVSSPESPPAVSSDKAILISVLHRVPTSSW